MTKVQEAVSCPRWQALRRSFVGTWKTRAEENVRALRRYLGKAKPGSPRFTAVKNYLVCSGFRSGAIRSADADALRDEMRAAEGRP